MATKKKKGGLSGLKQQENAWDKKIAEAKAKKKEKEDKAKAKASIDKKKKEYAKLTGK